MTDRGPNPPTCWNRVMYAILAVAESLPIFAESPSAFRVSRSAMPKVRGSGAAGVSRSFWGWLRAHRPFRPAGLPA